MRAQRTIERRDNIYSSNPLFPSLSVSMSLLPSPRLGLFYSKSFRHTSKDDLPGTPTVNGTRARGRFATRPENRIPRRRNFPRGVCLQTATINPLCIVAPRAGTLISHGHGVRHEQALNAMKSCRWSCSNDTKKRTLHEAKVKRISPRSFLCLSKVWL